MTPMPMVIQQYFQGVNQRDITLLTASLSADVQVQDEGEIYQGVASVCAWQRAAVARYQHHCHCVSWRQQQAQWYVDVEVRGVFAGSPVTLTFVFTLVQQLIARVEID